MVLGNKELKKPKLSYSRLLNEFNEKEIIKEQIPTTTLLVA